MSRWGVLGLALMLAGCAGDGGPRVGDLEDDHIVIHQGAAPSGDRQAAIEGYREFLANAPVTHPLYEDALMRLADMEMEHGEASQEQWEEQYMEAFRAAESMEAQPDAASYADAIEKYQRLLERDVDSGRVDWVLYQLARAYELSGKPRRALQTLSRLVSEHPDSRYALEARFRLAELYFRTEHYDQAAAAYRQVLARDDSGQFYEEALYKHGWALFKQEHYEAALGSFFQLFEVLDMDDPQAAGRGDRTRRQMRKDVARAMNLCFSNLGGAEAVGAYLDRHGSHAYDNVIYRQLGDFFLERDRITEAANVYKAFIARHPGDPQAPFLYQRIIAAYEQGGFHTEALRAKEDFVGRFGKLSDHWGQLSAADQRRLEKPLRATLQELARYYHAKAQKTNQRRYWQRALHWYQSYVHAFPDKPDTARMNFLLAEGLYEQGIYRQAAREYDKTAYDYPAHDDAAAAAYGALLAWDKYAARVSGDAQRQARRQWVDSASRYVERFPDTEQVVAVQTQLAERLYRLGEGERAVAQARRLTESGDGVPAASLSSAYTIIGHVAFEGGDFMLAQASYQKALKHLNDNDAMRQKLQRRLASAVYKQAEQQRAAGDAEGAARYFLRVKTLSAESGVAAKAAFDAATALMAAAQWSQAIDVLERFRKDYPRHELMPHVLEKLAVANEKAGHAAVAAGYYERLARQGEDREVRREAQWHAASLYTEQGQWKQAAAAYKRYIYDYPRPVERAMRARERIVHAYDQQGQPDKRDYWLKDIVDQVPPDASVDDDALRLMAARAALQLAEQPAAAFNDVQLVRPLKQSLRRKKRYMQQALSAYDKVNAYGVAQTTTRATFETAQIYNHMAQALLNAEPPKNLSSRELEQYSLLLEEQAYPFEEKAIEIHEANARRVKEGLYDQWVRRSFAALQSLRPARYAREETKDEYFAALN